MQIFIFKLTSVSTKTGEQQYLSAYSNIFTAVWASNTLSVVEWWNLNPKEGIGNLFASSQWHRSKYLSPPTVLPDKAL